jgi:hypothetical protein
MVQCRITLETEENHGARARGKEGQREAEACSKSDPCRLLGNMANSPWMKAGPCSVLSIPAHSDFIFSLLCHIRHDASFEQLYAPDVLAPNRNRRSISVITGLIHACINNNAG